MAPVAGLPTHGVRPQPTPRPTPPVTRVDRPVDHRSPTYRQVERTVEQEQAESPGRGAAVLAPRAGVEAVSTQSVLHLRQTAAPVARIAEAYGLAPEAVRRMLRGATGEQGGAAGPVQGDSQV
jgi:hypothetical protein